jgi:hypothetical protein
LSFITELIRHTKDYESPTSFWKWSGFAAIAAVLRDNVWMPDGDKKLYPNIYILFLADSGARKGRPVDLCEELVKELAVTKSISGRSSIQGIIDELAHTETRDGKMLKGGSAIWYAPELSSGIVSDEAAISILTDIYDGKTDFKNLLRHSPRFKVERIVFTAFMASNEAMLKSIYDARATQGGLLARTFLVTEQGEFRPSNALMRKTDMTESKKVVASELKKISDLRGEILFTEEAIKVYEPWYNEFRMSYRGRDKGGIAGRMHTGVKKLSCILAANDLSLEVRGKHIDEAIHECLILMPNYNSFIMGSGKSDISAAGALLIGELQGATDFCMDKRLILRKHWMDVDNDVLEKLAGTLAEAGMLTIIVSHPTVYYRLTDKALEMLGKRPKGTNA